MAEESGAEAPSDLRVTVLGPVRIEDRSHRLREPPGALAKNLIVALALARGFALSVPRLIEDLWDLEPPRQERAALQTLVSRLRSTSAQGILESSAGRYALAVSPEQTDLGRASAHLDAARTMLRSSDPIGAADEARRGLELWSGEPGADLGERPLAAELAVRAESVRSELSRIRVTALVEGRDAERALDAVEPLLAAAPLDEEVQYQHLRALELAGRRNDALRAFADYRSRLRDELGTSPGERLVQLHARLLREETAAALAPPVGASPAPVLAPLPATMAGVRIGVRVAPNALVGRDDDISRVTERVANSRLTTLLGPGGIGKTRLAQEVASRATTTPSVIVVELASVRSADDVALAFASTLGIREGRGTRVQALDPGSRIDIRTRILSALAEARTLLVVDNCEHLVDAAASWISDILESTTNVHILATSRAPLSIGAEQVYQLEPLRSAPAARADGERANSERAGGARTDGAGRGAEVRGYGPAVDLFVQRARAARPSVVLPLDTVARLCDRLDGLPLAIELAAARTRSMSVDEIERRIGNRFALLTGGERTAPERHRTLHAVIDWSWNLLGRREQRLLRRLARFPDGFSAEAASILAGGETEEVLDDLDALVGQSLVSVTEDPRTGILRYRMLETVREFGDLQLAEAGEAELVRERMFAWAAAYCRDRIEGIDGPEQVARLRSFAVEQDNLVTVLREALETARPDVVVNVFGGLGYFWTLRSNHSEVSAFAGSIADATRDYDPQPRDVLPAASTYALLAITLLYLDLRTSARILSRLRRLRGRHRIHDGRLSILSDLLLSRDTRRGQLDELLAAAENPDPHVSSIANLFLGGFYENAGEPEKALVSTRRAYELGRQADEIWAQASAAHSMAQLYSQMARPEEALEWAAQARTGFEELEATGDIRQLDWMIAANAVTIGDHQRARAILERFADDEDRALGIDYTDLRAIGYSGLAEIALAEGRTEEGLRLYRQAVAVFGPDFESPAPWLTIIVAARIVACLRATAGRRDGAPAGVQPVPPEADAMARRLASRLSAASRERFGFIDKPVLATGTLAIAAWLLLGAGVDAIRGIDPVAAGAELLALARRLASRQDIPSLHRAPIEHLARERHGDRAVDEAALRVDALASLDEATDRAIALLRAVTA